MSGAAGTALVMSGAGGGTGSGAQQNPGATVTIQQRVTSKVFVTFSTDVTSTNRQVIQLAHFQGLRLREIAEQTGLPLGTVKSRISYALRGLRLALEEMGVEP